MNTLETTETPGAVRTTSRAGRMVCAVVVTQPDTMPSASPACTIIVPKYDGSTTRSKATSTVTPLCARSAGVRRRRSSSRHALVAGSTTAAASMSTPSCAARERISPSSPSRVSRAIPRESTWSAARRMRSSAPSGSTMWAPAARARSTRSCSNISGVTAPPSRGRRDPVADQGVEVGVVGLVEQRDGRPELARGVGGDPPLDPAEGRRDRHRARLRRHDRQPHVEARDQPVDLR